MDAVLDIPEGFHADERDSPATNPWKPIYRRLSGGTVILGLRVGPAHTNSRGFVHGGLISALADNAMGHSCASRIGPGASLVTVSLTVDFLGSAFPVTRWQAWLTCGCALIVLVLLANLARSRVGRSWRAAGDDEVAAALAGLNVARLRVLAFVVSAACAGLAGALLAVTTSIISPDAFTLTLSIALLTGAVLGGLGTLPGAVWGSLVLVLVPTYVTDTASSHGLSSSAGSNIPVAAYGVVLIVVMLAFPNGIQGGLRRLGRPLAARLPAGGRPWRRTPAPPLHVPAGEHQEEGSI